ncbi:MAG: hypothetical protein JWM58_2635 [Rhizobium sp.]|nr:hypothetical protein [Rhizobium sp.]
MPQQEPEAFSAAGRVDRHDDAAQRTRIAQPQAFEHRPVPQCVLAVLDQLAVEFLAAQPRAAIALVDRLQKAGGEVLRIGAGRDPRHHRAGIVDQRPDQRHRPWRRRHHLARMAAEPQTELQHIPGFLAMLPFGKFVAPGIIELRTAQAVWILRRKDLRHRSVRPDQPPPGDLEVRPPEAGDPPDAGNAVDHHFAGVGQRLGDQREPHRFAGIRCDIVHPFGAGPGLARAAPAHHQPGPPVAIRRLLLRPAVETPTIMHTFAQAECRSCQAVAG